MAELRIRESTDTHAMAWAPHVAMYVWRKDTTLEGVAAAAAALDACRAASPHGVGVLVGFVEEHAPPPSAEVRGPLGDLLNRGAGFIRASALVFAGKGFRASLVRMVASGLTLVARPPFPHRVFASVEDASLWLGPAVPQFDAASLPSMVQMLRDAPCDDART